MEKAGAPAFGLLLAKREKSEAAKGGERPDARWRVKRVRRPCGAARAGAAGGGGRAGGRTGGRAAGGTGGLGTRRRKARIGVRSRGRGWTRGWARAWRGPARDGGPAGGGLRALPEPGAGPRGRPPPPPHPTPPPPLRGLAPLPRAPLAPGAQAVAAVKQAPADSSRAHVRCPSVAGSRPLSVMGGGGGGGAGARRTMAADAGVVGAGASAEAGMEEAGLWGSTTRGFVSSSGLWRPFTMRVILEQVGTAIKGWKSRC